MLKPLIYLDLCCYKRPFDDQGDPRIRREVKSAEAGGAQYFVTVDRRLIRRLKRVREAGKNVHIEVVTPGMRLSLLEE